MHHLTHRYITLQKLLADWFCEYYYFDEENPENWKDYLDDPHWIGSIGGIGGTTMSIGDVFIGLEDIIYLIESKTPCRTFLDWYWNGVETKDRTNLRSYVGLRGKGTHKEYLKYQREEKKRRKTPEYKKQIEEDLKKIRDKGFEELKKYIKPITTQTHETN